MHTVGEVAAAVCAALYKAKEPLHQLGCACCSQTVWCLEAFVARPWSAGSAVLADSNLLRPHVFH